MKMKHGILFSIIAFLLLILVIFIGKKIFFVDNTLYIAVAGPLQETNGIAMKQGIQLYLDQINEQGGIEGRQVKLLKFDDKDKVEVAKQKALEIANSKAHLVIGHYSSETSLQVAHIYKKHQIPAITGTATADDITKNNDWYFRVLFNNSDQGAVLANYVHKILGYNKAYIFFDKREYGSSLENAFTKTAKLIGLKVVNKWGFNPGGFENRLNEMIETLKQDKKEDFILFVATHSTEAVETIVGLRRLTRQIPIIGGDAFSSSLFIHTLHENYPQERAHPGYYTNGIYVASQFLIDIGGKRAQNFRREFVKKYHVETNLVTAALYYDAAMVAVDALEKMLKQEPVSTLDKQRQQIKNNLRKLSKLEKALEGVTGYLYFDNNGDAVKPVLIGVYKKGKAIATLEQYQPLINLQNIDNLLQEVLDNEVIQVNDKFMRKAQVVFVGIDFNDIHELNIETATYIADFYLWFRFKPDQHRSHIDNINFVNIFRPEENELKTKEEIATGFKQVKNPSEQITDNNTNKPLTITYRLKRRFKVDFDFSHYPLDKQILPIRFWHNQLTIDKLIYVIDTEGMGINHLGKQTIANKLEIDKNFSIGDWQVNKLSFFQDSQKNDSTLGDPDLFGSQQRLEYSQFNVEINIERHVLSFILKTLLPIIFVVGLGYAVYFTDVFATKMMLSINVILSTSLFHLKLASSLAVGYNVLIEYIFYLVYMMGIFGVVVSLIFNAKNEERKTTQEKCDEIQEQLDEMEKGEKPLPTRYNIKKAELEQAEKKLKKNKMLIERLDWWGRIGYPLVLFIAIIAIFHKHLF